VGADKTRIFLNYALGALLFGVDQDYGGVGGDVVAVVGGEVGQLLAIDVRGADAGFGGAILGDSVAVDLDGCFVDGWSDGGLDGEGRAGTLVDQ
jgi:hypothetical protein